MSDRIMNPFRDPRQEVERLRDQIRVIGGAITFLAHEQHGDTPENALARTIGDEPKLHDDVGYLLREGAEDVIANGYRAGGEQGVQQ